MSMQQIAKLAAPLFEEGRFTADKARVLAELIEKNPEDILWETNYCAQDPKKWTPTSWNDQFVEALGWERSWHRKTYNTSPSAFQFTRFGKWNENFCDTFPENGVKIFIQWPVKNIGHVCPSQETSVYTFDGAYNLIEHESEERETLFENHPGDCWPPL